MLKRIAALLLCLMVIAALPFSAFATETTEPTQPQKEEKEPILPLPKWEAAVPIYDLPNHSAQIERMKHDIPFHHQEALIAAEMESLGGYCGLFASYQLYYQGINSWLKTHHGNDHFDVYSQMSVTSGGYRPHAYQLEDYTMEEALYAATGGGSFDAYNLLVCFQWTDTEAGQIYGHVVYIYAILDGIVYFTESFDTALGTKAGEVIAVSIPRFVQYYADWTTYEGTILFGKPDFVENGFTYETDMFVKTMADTELLSQPCSVEADVLDTEVLRPVKAGERLHVKQLYRNILGESFYRVEENGLVGWLPARKAGPILFLDREATLTNVKLPAEWTDMKFTGSVTAPGAKVVLRLLDSEREVVGEYTVPTYYSKFDLSRKSLLDAVKKEVLKDGWYTWQLVEQTQNCYLRDEKVAEDVRETVLQTQIMAVGQPDKQGRLTETEKTEEPVKNGWFYENKTWYCYDNGKPRTGWYTSGGIDYYLKKDGSVTTGTAVVGGKERTFTATGALRTGWMETEQGTKYLLSNGLPVYGWMEIDGAMYCFDVYGLRKQSCWITEANARKYLLADGKMATGRVVIRGVSYCFDSNGCLTEEVKIEVKKPRPNTGFLPE